MKYNTKIKVYSDGTTNITYCTQSIFKDDEQKALERKMWEDIQQQIDDECSLNERKKDCDIEDKKLCNNRSNRSDNLKHARDCVYDIAYQNTFNWFVTGTINPNIIDSSSPKDVSKKLIKWLNNMQQRKNLEYLLIPEYHKSGRIHFHALMRGNLSLADSGHKTKDNKTIFNISDWKYGFSTAIDITGDKTRLANYITKYITKDLTKIFGKYYWSSRSLIRKTETLLTNTDFFSQPLKEYNILPKLSFKYELQSYTKEKEK